MPPQQQAPLIQTKVFIPTPRARLVRRPYLIEKLEAGALAPLTLVSAPAGFGKTTLLAEWAARSATPVAWVSLDGEDDDPQPFLAYILAALRRVMPKYESDARQMMATPQPIHHKAILAGLINKLSQTQTAYILVLDDYQFIENRSVHELTAFLLDHLPPKMRLVIATRSDPPLALARMRARNQIVEIRTDDLRFNLEEAADFLSQNMGLELNLEELATLEARTEGWVVGLQMAALSLKGRQDAAGFIRSFSGSHRYILEYLIEEVLDRQDEEIKEFLLRTSILVRLSAPLCDVLLGKTTGQETLEKMEKANLFLVALDDDRHWYRYHHLFADLLRLRLRQVEPDLIPGLHRLASHWYDEQGLKLEAINHALAGGDHQLAAELVERSAPQMMARGEMTTLIGKLRALPKDTIRERPLLSLDFAMALVFSGQIVGVEEHLQAAEQSLHGAEDDFANQEILGGVAAVRAIIAEMKGEIEHAIANAHQAEKHLPEGSPFLLSAVIPFILSDGYFALGDLEKARTTCAEILEIGRATGNPWTIAVAAGKQANLEKIQGRLLAAGQVYDDVYQWLDALGERDFVTVGAVYAGHADLLRERDELEAANEVAQKAIEMINKMGNPTDLVNGYTVLGQIHLAQGDLDGAEKAFEEADRFARSPGVFEASLRLYKARRIRFWLAQGQLGLATLWAGEIQKAAKDEGPGGGQPGLPHELEQIAVARVLIAQGLNQDAINLLDRTAKRAELGMRFGRLIEMRLLQALAFYALGRPQPAFERLQESLSLSDQEGYKRLFLDEGQPMRSLLKAYQGQLERGSHTRRQRAFVERLLGAYPQMAEEPAGKIKEPHTKLVDALSPRELEVLSLICQGLSNNEIKDSLFISINTVKRHNNSIFSKLGVKNRAQAILRAQALGLIS